MAEHGIDIATAAAAGARAQQDRHRANPRSRGPHLHKSLGNTAPQGVAAPTVSAAAGAIGHEPGSVTLNRSKLVQGASPGNPVELSKWWLPTGDRVTEKKGQNVELRQESVQAAYKFLDEYVNEWAAKAKEPAPSGSAASNMLEHLLQNPTNQEMAYVMKLLSRTDVGAAGESLVSADPAKIKEFLKSEESWPITLMLMEQKALMNTLALSATLEIRMQVFNRYQREDVSGKTILDQGPSLPAATRKLINTLAGAGLAVGYFLGGTGNVKHKFSDDKEILAAVQSLPAERKAYLKAMTGVDVDRLVGVNAQGVEGYNVLVQDLKSEISALYEARASIIDQIVGNESFSRFGRIDRGRKIRTPEDHIFEGRDNGEQNAMRYFRRYMDVYVDDATRGTLTPDRLFASSRARKQVLCEYLEDIVMNERAKAADAKEAGLLPALKAREAKIHSDPDGFTRDEVEKHTKAKQKADEKVEAAKERKTALITGESSISAKAQAVATQEAALSRDYDLDPDVDIRDAMKAKLQELEDKANDAADKLNEAREKKTEKVTDLRDKVTADISKIATDFAASIPAATRAAITPPAIDPKALGEAGYDAINAEFDGKISRLQTLYDTAEALRKQFETQSKAYQAAVREFESATRELAKQQTGQIDRSIISLDRLTSPVPIPPATVPGPYAGDPEKVRELPVVDIVKALESAGLPTPTSTEAERIELSLMAKAAEQAIRVAALTPDQQSAIGVLETAGISYDSMLLKTRVELRAAMKLFYPTMPAEDIDMNIEAAFTGQATYLRALAESQADQEIAYYEEISKAEQKAIESPDIVKAKKAEIAAAIGVMTEVRKKGPDGLYARIAGLSDDLPRRQALGDSNPIAKDDSRFSEAEKESGLTVGEVRWYRELFPGYSTADNKDDIFNALLRALPPATLRQYLKDNLNIAGPSDYAIIATALRTMRFTPPLLIKLAKAFAVHIGEFGLTV